MSSTDFFFQKDTMIQSSSKFLFITRSELTEFGHGRKVFALKFHPFDDNVFITGGWDKCIKVTYCLFLNFFLKS